MLHVFSLMLHSLFSIFLDLASALLVLLYRSELLHLMGPHVVQLMRFRKNMPSNCSQVTVGHLDNCSDTGTSNLACLVRNQIRVIVVFILIPLSASEHMHRTLPSILN